MSTIDSLNAALTGRYEIEREAGAGGMSTVYLARDGVQTLNGGHCVPVLSRSGRSANRTSSPVCAAHAV